MIGSNHTVNQRRQKILLLIEQLGKVKSEQLAERFHVGRDIIQQDLLELEHGGLLTYLSDVALPRPIDAGGSFLHRKHCQHEAKLKLAKEAAQLVRSGQTIFIDASTTHLQLAHCFSPNLQATFVTNSPLIAQVLTEKTRSDVFVIGGQYNVHQQALVGLNTEQDVQQWHADIYFMSVSALHHEFGVRTGNEMDVGIKRAMLQAATQTVAIATEDKLGAVERFAVTSVDNIDVLVTEQSMADTAARCFADDGMALIFV